MGLFLKKNQIKSNQNPPKKLTKTHTKPTRKIMHKNKHYQKKKKNQFSFYKSLPH
jgi:hypothetical protein